jgi:3-dehydroquinate synthase
MTMQPILQTIQVPFCYPVYFTSHLFQPGNPVFKEALSAGGGPPGRGLLFVADRGVVAHHPALLSRIEAYCRENHLPSISPPLVVDGGEGVKNDPASLETVYAAIEAEGLCRHSYVVAIGGGAVLDMVGYAAATAHRGLRLVRVPTTTLSQDDSGIGVKNGINAFGRKNFLGTFHPPFAVLNDSDFLTTLSVRDWRSGIAEAVKVALIKDLSFFEFLEEQASRLVCREMGPMERLIVHSAGLHLRHIAAHGDPFELGSSRPLDFGHWSAHKLEQLTHYRLRHGEAVAVGIALDTTYSYLAGFLSGSDWERVLRLLSVIGFTLYLPELEAHLHQRDDLRCLLSGLTEFREHLGGELTIMLLKKIGEGIEVNRIDEALFVESIALLKRRAGIFAFPIQA